MLSKYFVSYFIQLKANLQSLIAEHNVDVSKLQSTTKEHTDTTNAFTLMHKEIEQLRIEKYAPHNNNNIPFT